MHAPTGCHADGQTRAPVGNIFDLGAAASAEHYKSNGISFSGTRSKLLARPWAVDDMDQLLASLTSKKYSKAIMFVDNAGDTAQASAHGCLQRTYFWLRLYWAGQWIDEHGVIMKPACSCTQDTSA